jgi:hypothetical protein
MNIPLRTLCVSLAALAFLILATEANGQVLVPNLEGETLQNADINNSSISCAADPNSTTGEFRIDFSVNGVAVGPFSGKFNESGFITFDPISGLVTGGKIEFSISSTKGTQTGTKVPLDGKASCTVDKATGMTVISATVPTLDYKASVGGTIDTGKATLDLFASSDKSLGLTTLLFTEIFHSSNLVPSTFGKVTGGGNISPTAGGSGVTFGFNAQNTENGMKGSGTIIDHNAGVRVKILDVTTFSIVGTHATFTGTAEVNGVVEKYRIDVDDLGEPGTGLDSFKIVTDSYGAGGTLSGGNIQVHK